MRRRRPLLESAAGLVVWADMETAETVAQKQKHWNISVDVQQWALSIGGGKGTGLGIAYKA